MNRFFDIPTAPLEIFAPWELKRLGLSLDRAWYRTTKAVRMYSDIAKGIIEVPAGYITDFASIPHTVQGVFLLHDSPQIALGALIHDWLYGNKGRITVLVGEDCKPFPNLLTREQSDSILCHEAMPELYASKGQCDTVYLTLRTVGNGWGDNYPITERLSL